MRGALKALDSRRFHHGGCKKPETPRRFGERRAQEMPRASECRRFYDGGAGSLRRPTIFVKGGCTELEAVGSFQPGGAKSLRRPLLLVSGEHRKCPEPETVGNFMMGVQKACAVPQVS